MYKKSIEHDESKQVSCSNRKASLYVRASMAPCISRVLWPQIQPSGVTVSDTRLEV